jgi:Skp family chaperone for outer membrane proteins
VPYRISTSFFELMKNKATNRTTMRNATFMSILLFLLTASTVSAQNYGFIHRDSILKSAPNYIPKLQELSANQKKYSAEIKQGMEDLQSKVSELLKPYKPNEQESIVGIKARMNGLDTVKLNLLLDEEKSLKKKEESYNYMLNFT